MAIFGDGMDEVLEHLSLSGDGAWVVAIGAWFDGGGFVPTEFFGKEFDFRIEGGFELDFFA